MTKELTQAQKNLLWDEVRKEFPGDEMMQEVHYVRLLHYHQSRELPAQERIDFYAFSEADSHSGRLASHRKPDRASTASQEKRRSNTFGAK